MSEIEGYIDNGLVYSSIKLCVFLYTRFGVPSTYFDDDFRLKALFNNVSL